MKTTKSNGPRKDWCTLDIVKSCKIKCRLYYMFIRKPINNIIYKQNYITFRNRRSQTIRNARQTYYSNRITKSNINKTWSYINSIIKGNKFRDIPCKIHNNDRLITNSKSNCACFESYLTSLGTYLSNGTPSSADPLNYVKNIIILFSLLQLKNI